MTDTIYALLAIAMVLTVVSLLVPLAERFRLVFEFATLGAYVGVLLTGPVILWASDFRRIWSRESPAEWICSTVWPPPAMAGTGARGPRADG